MNTKMDEEKNDNKNPLVDRFLSREDVERDIADPDKAGEEGEGGDLGGRQQEIEGQSIGIYQEGTER